MLALAGGIPGREEDARKSGTGRVPTGNSFKFTTVGPVTLLRGQGSTSRTRMAAPSELGNSDSEDELESLSQILRHLEHSGSPRQHLRVSLHARIDALDD